MKLYITLGSIFLIHSAFKLICTDISPKLLANHSGIQRKHLTPDGVYINGNENSDSSVRFWQTAQNNKIKTVFLEKVKDNNEADFMRRVENINQLIQIPFWLDLKTEIECYIGKDLRMITLSQFSPQGELALPQQAAIADLATLFGLLTALLKTFKDLDSNALCMPNLALVDLFIWKSDLIYIFFHNIFDIQKLGVTVPVDKISNGDQFVEKSLLNAVPPADIKRAKSITLDGNCNIISFLQIIKQIIFNNTKNSFWNMLPNAYVMLQLNALDHIFQLIVRFNDLNIKLPSWNDIGVALRQSDELLASLSQPLSFSKKFEWLLQPLSPAEIRRFKNKNKDINEYFREAIERARESASEAIKDLKAQLASHNAKKDRKFKEMDDMETHILEIIIKHTDLIEASKEKERSHKRDKDEKFKEDKTLLEKNRKSLEESLVKMRESYKRLEEKGNKLALQIRELEVWYEKLMKDPIVTILR